MLHTLSTTEVFALLARHPETGARVAEFDAMVALLGYDQLRTAPGFFEFDISVPGSIPPYGIGIVDSTWGEVQIAPDASGTLRYTGGNPLPGFDQLSKPEFSSPAPDSPSTTDMLQSILTYAKWGLLAVLVFYLFTLFRLAKD